MPSENGIGAILRNCTKIWALLPISDVRRLNLSCGNLRQKRSWHYDVVLKGCVKKDLKMQPRSRKKGPRLPCTCSVCRGAMMSARTVRLHNLRPHFNPTLGSGSSYQMIGSCHWDWQQPIFGSVVNSTTLQGTNPTTSPLMNNPMPTAATRIWMPTVPKPCKLSRSRGQEFRLENSR
jgi:hypothetical protein